LCVRSVKLNIQTVFLSDAFLTLDLADRMLIYMSL
jgi:hypothetical protein